MDAGADLERGRRSFARRSWRRAYDSLSRADAQQRLGADDLERLARAAYMLGYDDDYVRGLERAHQGHLDAGRPAAAARCAFWIGHNLVFRGQLGPARGWFARAERVLQARPGSTVEEGYLLIPVLLEHVFRGDADGAASVASEIVEVGERHGDRDLVALGVMEQGHALVRQGRLDEGLRLVDEAMVAVTSGELSPIVAGIVYCNMIAFCRSIFEVGRAREWTTALTSWCEAQSEMVAHNGPCLVHRAELMTLGGDWPDALEELHRLQARFTRGALNQLALGDAAYQQGEVRRLRGEHDDAMAAYRDAEQHGRDPQPGLALLRLAQGQDGAATASIRRAMIEATRWRDRASLLPAYVEIMLAVGDGEAARAASRELAEIAAQKGSRLLEARSAHAAGAVRLADGQADAALIDLRRAWNAWQDLEAPHEAARARVLIARCCRALGDLDTATRTLTAARETFVRLRAAPDLAQVDALTRSVPPDPTLGLTGREVEVLRLVATGLSNRQIAAELFISEHTVARHLQNIFTKLDVSSRTAASAVAHERELLGHGQD